MTSLTRNEVETDGVLVSRRVYQPHENRIYRELSQPNDKLILARNQELRNNPGALRDLSFGRMIADIPILHMEQLKEKYPNLGSRDKDIRSKALFDLLNSSEGKRYLVGKGT